MDHLFDGVIGDRLVYSGMGVVGVNGRVASTDAYFMGVISVHDTGSRLFDGRIGVRGVTERVDLFDGQLAVRGKADSMFDGVVRVQSVMNVFVEGAINVA